MGLLAKLETKKEKDTNSASMLDYLGLLMQNFTPKVTTQYSLV